MEIISKYKEKEENWKKFLELPKEWFEEKYIKENNNAYSLSVILGINDISCISKRMRELGIPDKRKKNKPADVNNKVEIIEHEIPKTYIVKGEEYHLSSKFRLDRDFGELKKDQLVEVYKIKSKDEVWIQDVYSHMKKILIKTEYLYG